MLIKKVGDWAGAQKILDKAAADLVNAEKKAVRQEGQFLRTKIVEGLREQAPGGKSFAPLSQTTLANRRANGFKGSKALIVRGDLRNSIKAVESGDSVFIGVQRTERSKDGKLLADIAEIHEFGSKPIVIQMTAKMRRYLMAMYRRAGVPYRPGNGTGIIVSRIPARPFIGPVFEKFGSGTQIRDRIEARMAEILKGTLAK